MKDGMTIATFWDDCTAKVWMTDGSLIATLEGHSDRVSEVQFSPNGEALATASRDGTAKVWPWSLDALITYACQNMEGYLLSSSNVQPGDKDLCD